MPKRDTPSWSRRASHDEGLAPPNALEAALFLREWARGKIPPDELASLLPKL